MGARGPAPTPTAILAARGSWRAAARKGEPKPKVGTPVCPRWLSDEARKIWRRLVPLLVPSGVLTVVDGGALARYCDTWVRWHKAAAALDKYGDVLVRRDESGAIRSVEALPYVAIYRNLSDMLSRYESQFGLTPAARARLAVEKSEQTQDDILDGPMRLVG